MSDAYPQLLQFASSLCDVYKEPKDAYVARAEYYAATFRKQVACHRQVLLGSLFENIPEILSLKWFSNLILNYCQILEWSLVDLSFFAAAIEGLEDDLVEDCAWSSMAYHAFRIIDDVIDDHEDYKGGYTTLLGQMRHGQFPINGIHAQDACILGALAMVMISTRHISAELLETSRRTILGALIELDNSQAWTRNRYDEMVASKMVAYSQLLYRPVVSRLTDDEQVTMSSFLDSSFHVSQYLNDLHDAAEDRVRYQPNIVVILEQDGIERVDATITDALRRTAVCSYDLSTRLMGYAQRRLYDLANYALKYLMHGDLSKI